MQGTGAGMSTVSSVFGAIDQKRSLNYQADIADINSRLNEMSADQEIKKGQFQEQALMQDVANVKGTQRSSMAANGLELTEGTARNILESTDYMAERDLETIRTNAARAAFGQRTQALNYKNQAAAYRMQSDQISPFWAGATSLIGGAGNVAAGWYSMNKYDSLLSSSKTDSSSGSGLSRPFSISKSGGKRIL
ncbi:hypothetical protein EBT16_04165 [bacterium]|nr:hypothetical protein [bacterium]